MTMIRAKKLPDGCTLVTSDDYPGYGVVIPFHGLYIPIRIDGITWTPFGLEDYHGYILTVPSQNAAFALFDEEQRKQKGAN